MSVVGTAGGVVLELCEADVDQPMSVWAPPLSVCFTSRRPWWMRDDGRGFRYVTTWLTRACPTWSLVSAAWSLVSAAWSLVSAASRAAGWWLDLSRLAPLPA